MVSSLDPTIANKIATEMVALGEGSAPLEADLRQELGRLSFTTTVIHETVDGMESAAANLKLVKDFSKLLPRAYLGNDRDGSFKLNSQDTDVQYQARKLQTHVIWLPGVDTPNGLDSKDRFHPAYVLGRREDPQRPDVVELILSPNIDMPYSYWDIGVKIVKVLKDDLIIRDELVAASEAKDYPEDKVHEMITPEGDFKIDAKTPGSFMIRRGGKGKPNVDLVQSRGIRLADRGDRGTLLEAGISNTIMEEFGIGSMLAKLAQEFNVSADLAKLLRQDDNVTEPSQTGALPEKGSLSLEALIAQNRDLKQALGAALAASGLFSQEEITARIGERFPDLGPEG